MAGLSAFISEGVRLAENLAALGANAAKSAYDAAQSQVSSYWRLVKRWTIKALAVTAGAVLLLVLLMISGLPPNGFHVALICVIVAVIALWLLLLYPVWVVYGAVKRHFPSTYDLLVEPLRLIRSVAGVTAAGLVVLITSPHWKDSDGIWLGIAILASALVLPVLTLSGGMRRTLPALQFLYLGLVFFALLLLFAFPEQGRIAGRALKVGFGQAISGWAQTELTHNWRSINRWFSDAGEPLVYYSGDATNGYRLWKSPGYDRHTREQLIAVESEEVKKGILKWFETSGIESRDERAEKAAAAARSQAPAQQGGQRQAEPAAPNVESLQPPTRYEDWSHLTAASQKSEDQKAPPVKAEASQVRYRTNVVEIIVNREWQGVDTRGKGFEYELHRTGQRVQIRLNKARIQDIPFNSKIWLGDHFNYVEIRLHPEDESTTKCKAFFYTSEML